MRKRTLALAFTAVTTLIPTPAHAANPRAPKRPATADKLARGINVRRVQAPAARPADARPAVKSPAATVRPSRSAAQIAVAAAKSQIGKPYRYGATGPYAFDCSGLTSWAWGQAGVSIPRTSRSQYSSLRRVSISDLQPGDLVYSPGHIGMYIGNGQMVHAPETGRRVEIAPLRSRISGAVRPGA